MGLSAAQPLGDRAEQSEDCLVRKYGHGSRGLSAGQITEQFVNLSRCERDKEMRRHFAGCLEGLERLRKGARGQICRRDNGGRFQGQLALALHYK